MVLWNDILTDVLKKVIALSRPFYMDSAVKFLCTEHANPAPFKAWVLRNYWNDA